MPNPVFVLLRLACALLLCWSVQAVSAADPPFSDADWHAFGGISGANGYVSNILPYRDGFVVAGDFTAIGDEAANGLAYWDGESWTDLGAGISRSGFYGISALATDGESLYIGGYFTLDVSPWSSFIAQWDGTEWRDLGGPTNGQVESLLWRNGVLYAGGQFTIIGGVAAQRFAQWDGVSWSEIGGGVDGGVYAIAASETDVYIGGSFHRPGGSLDGFCVARWDGSSWHAMGQGLAAGVVRALRVVGNDVYAGGDFTSIDGVAAGGIARWDGSTWHAVGTGFSAVVQSIEYHAGRLYVGGGYVSSFGANLKGVASWDGTSWMGLGAGLEMSLYNPSVSVVRSVGADLLVGGRFYSAGGAQSPRIARWTTAGWAPLQMRVGNGLVSAFSVATLDGKVYVGGVPALGGATRSGAVLCWDGDAWSPIGALAGATSTLAASAGRLYWGGWYIKGDGTTPWSVWQWNGSTWTLLGTMDGAVYRVVPYRDGIAVGGQFRTVDGIPANAVAYWDGQAWSAFGSGIDPGTYTPGTVHDLQASGDNLYAAGLFSNAGGAIASNIARWDGASWAPLGGGVENRARVIGVLGSEVFVAGDFVLADGSITVAGFARWNGWAWSRCDCPVSVASMQAYNGTMIAAGGSGSSVTTVSSWDGDTWTSLGSGVAHAGTRSAVTGMAVSGTALYVVGELTSAGGKTSVGIARWSPNTSPEALSDADPADNIVLIGGAVGSYAGVTAHAVDPQGDRLSYALADDAGGVFTIGPTSGAVRLARSPSEESYSIVVRASDGSLSTDLTIALEGRSPPGLSAVAPNASPSSGGIQVTISGTHLADVSSVTIGGAAASGITGNSSDAVTFTVPPHAAGVVDIAVTTPSGSAVLTGAFTYLPPPAVISSLSPDYGPVTGATIVTIAGNGMAGVTAVTFDGVSGSDLAVLSPTSLRVTTPPHAAGSVPVVVITPGGASGSSSFSYHEPIPSAPDVGNVGGGGGDGGGAGAGGCGAGALALIVALMAMRQLRASRPSEAGQPRAGP